MSGPRPFDVCGHLPAPGVTVLEASAGTGKTFTIAALAARYVAAGLPLEQLLLITFTRMATGELRQRVRDRLVSAETGLARVLDGVAPPTDDEVLAVLAAVDRDEVAARRERLLRAVAEFDAATITTTHGFCQAVLSGLGVAGDVQQDVTFAEDLTDLVTEVVDDLYVRRFHGGAAPPFDRTEALRIGQAVVANPGAPIDPRVADESEPWAMRRRLGEVVRAEVERRKRATGVMTYDDLLTRLSATLRDPARGPIACDRLRARYRVVLVDEFQDTDPIQWDIVRRAFGDGRSTLVLIGDPKQAIYAFRGADVFAYLEAAADAASRATLQVNWRSDQGLVDAYDALFGGCQLGHEGIRYRTVRAAPDHVRPRLRGAPVAAPLRIRVAHRDDGAVTLTRRGFMPKWPVSRFIAEDVAADVVRLLVSGAELLDAPTPVRPGDIAVPVRPGDIAVLVRMHRQAALVQEALGAAGVPAVVGGAGSVFGTAAATEWLRLLEAAEQPASRQRAAGAALTEFVGWSAGHLATADDQAWEQLQSRLHEWSAVWRRRGVAALLEHVTRSEHLPGRILGRASGERLLTDIGHIGELLHVAATTEALGPSALAAWLRRRIAEADDDVGEEDRSRRLESDAEAVQVLTIHRSKGLEFPIVYCPYLWEAPVLRGDAIPVFHDPTEGNRRTIDVGRDGPGFSRHLQMNLAEQRGEDLRLAYVALTRARHQAVVWWAAAAESKESPLGRLLFGRGDDGSVAQSLRSVPSDDEVAATVAELAAPGIAVERATGPTGDTWCPSRGGGDDLDVSPFGRSLDRAWRRASYTSITAATHEQTVGSEAEERVIDDETADGVPVAGGGTGTEAGAGAGAAGLRAVPLLLAEMPGGTLVGTLIHRVLETVDFTSPRLDADLRGELHTQAGRRRVDLGDIAVAAAGLRTAIETPLGPLAGGLRLRDVGRSDRLDEVGFELPIAGGDRAWGRLSMDEVASLLSEHLADDPVLPGYGARLADPSMERVLRGYLTGSLDLVVRAGGRFFVVDYKTNWLASGDEVVTAWHYRRAALVAEMQRAHYPLQALLYSVALHRYLRWRLAGYEPTMHLGGVLYLFLRGMSSPAFPSVGDDPCGVFAWCPPVTLIEALSDAFDRGRLP